MNRNAETFKNIPELVDVQRSKFTRDSGLHTSFSAGLLVPIFLDEVLPGDSFDMTLSSSVRMSTPISPVMDDCYLDTYFFYVPSRLCWNRWKEFCGENHRANWNSSFDDINIEIPKIAFADASFQPLEEGFFVSHPDKIQYPSTLERTLVDYFGLPYLNFEDHRAGDLTDYTLTNTFNMLPFEAYNLIWNNFFRDKNYSDPCPLLLQETSATDQEVLIHDNVYYTTDQVRIYDTDSDAWKNTNQYLAVKPVAKFHDYFTSVLPSPQRGAPVILPGFTEDVPVASKEWVSHDVSTDSLRFLPSQYASLDTYNGILKTDGAGLVGLQTSTTSNLNKIYPANLWAFNSSIAPTINDLRNAFAIQRLLEKDALGGSLYSELLYSHFGVSNPDSRVQLPEYLGGDRIHINMEQVVQTSESNVTPQGNVSGLSLTNSIGSTFVKSFTEHGYIIGLCCVRPAHSYQNGVNKLWSRSSRFDFYYPSLANIGEQPVMKNELVATPTAHNQAIGYQEAWAEYRYKPSLVTGSMRSGLDDSLDIWHYADNFNSAVSGGDIFMGISSEFMYENSKTIDRTLAVSSQLEPQFFGDFYFKCDTVRIMPVYSIPGLVDHH